jgi:hypothetical protein
MQGYFQLHTQPEHNYKLIVNNDKQKPKAWSSKNTTYDKNQYAGLSDVYIYPDPTLQLLLEGWKRSCSSILYWDTVVHGMGTAKEALLFKTALSRVICCVADPTSSCLSCCVRMICY